MNLIPIGAIMAKLNPAKKAQQKLKSGGVVSKSEAKRKEALIKLFNDDIEQTFNSPRSVTVTVGEDGFIPLETFKDFVDITKVKYYDFKINKDKTVTVLFYDKNKKKVKPQ